MANVGKGTPELPDHGWPLYIVSVVLVIVSGFFVIGRVAFRLSRRAMGSDDHIIIAALIALVTLSLTECSAVVHGYGRHYKSLTHAEVVTALKWFYGAQITYKLAISLNKLSILFLYLRIFIDQNFRYMCFFGIAFCGASGLAFVLVTIWQCTPLAAFWDKTIPGGHCFHSEAFWFSYSIINIVTDVFILALPIRQIMSLELATRDKWGLVGIFSVGIFVCITSIIRTTTLAASSNSKDGTWNPIPATVWSVVEANTGTICACLPMLRQPIAHIFQSIFPSSTRKETSLKGRPAGYALQSKSKAADVYSGNRTNSEYHQWAMASRRASKPEPDSRGSEEYIIPTGAGIVRTTDVSVMYHTGETGDEESIPSIPSVKNHLG